MQKNTQKKNRWKTKKIQSQTSLKGSVFWRRACWLCPLRTAGRSGRAWSVYGSKPPLCGTGPQSAPCCKKTKGLFFFLSPDHRVLLFLCWSLCSFPLLVMVPCKAQQEQSKATNERFFFLKIKKIKNLDGVIWIVAFCFQKYQTDQSEASNFSCGLPCLESSLWHHNMVFRPPAIHRLRGHRRCPKARGDGEYGRCFNRVKTLGKNNR